MRANDENLIPNNILPGLYFYLTLCSYLIYLLGLFLGGVVAARDKYTLKRLGIRHILTVAEIDPLYAEVLYQYAPYCTNMRHLFSCFSW